MGTNIFWITRVPATISEAKDLLDADIEMMPCQDDRYSCYVSLSSYGGIEQIWVMFHSKPMQERMEKSFQKGLEKDTKSAQVDLNKFMRREFACEADARKESEIWLDEHPFHKLVDLDIVTRCKRAGQLAALGTNRGRFSSSLEVAEYSGIAPVTERSGKSKWVHRRFACSKFVKQSFHEFAARSIPHCNWARGYYDQKKTEGKKHHAAVRAPAYRWIRIIYRCWKDRIPYDEDKYMKALRQRKPAWLQSLPLSET